MNCHSRLHVLLMVYASPNQTCGTVLRTQLVKWLNTAPSRMPDFW